MNKKILALFLLVIAVGAVSVVSAQDTQKIADIEFNIPEGYAYDADSADIFLKSFSDESNLEDAGVFKNSDDEILAILVYSKEPKDTGFPNDYKVEKKTINNKNGTFVSAPSRINVGFMYDEGDNFVLMQAMNEDVLKQTIK